MKEAVPAELDTQGFCCVCGHQATFKATPSQWGSVRESMRCSVCHSISRKRHLVKVLLELFAAGAASLPEGRAALSRLEIYSAVANDPLHLALAPDNPNYVCSEYFPGVPEGATKDGILCQNLEQLSFAAARFDLVITEDVLEHVRRPRKALQEIHRVLKRGGYHVFTVPFLFDRKTVSRVNTGTDQDVPTAPAAYHTDALRREILVYTDFGYDYFETLNDVGFYTEVRFAQFRDAVQCGIADSFVFTSCKITD